MEEPARLVIFVVVTEICKAIRWFHTGREFIMRVTRLLRAQQIRIKSACFCAAVLPTVPLRLVLGSLISTTWRDLWRMIISQTLLKFFLDDLTNIKTSFGALIPPPPPIADGRRSSNTLRTSWPLIYFVLRKRSWPSHLLTDFLCMFATYETAFCIVGSRHKWFYRARGMALI